MTIETTITNECIQFDASNGESVIVRLADMPIEILNYAALHGLKQKIGDAGAISRNPDTGRSATDADKLAAMGEVLKRLLAGNWNKGRGDGTGAGAGGLLFRALCVVYPNKSPGALREYLAKKSAAEKHHLRTHAPAIAAAIEEIKSKMADDGDTPDVDALLSELDD